MAVVRCLMNLAKVPNDQMTRRFILPIGFCPCVPYAKQNSGRVHYWVIWSLGQRNKFISHPTTAIRQLTFGHKACPALRVSQCQPEGTVLSPALQRHFGIRLLGTLPTQHATAGSFCRSDGPALHQPHTVSRHCPLNILRAAEQSLASGGKAREFLERFKAETWT